MKILIKRNAEKYYVKYFNGFCLQNEEQFLQQYIPKGETTVAGLSYGAQLAFEWAYHSSQRVDRLILLSPAFFQTKTPSFIRTQLRYFDQNQEAYIRQFLLNVAFPSSVDLVPYLAKGTKDELVSLLDYVWGKEKIKTVLSRGTTIEVFLGSEDKIIDSKMAFDFFGSLTATYQIKNVGHLLV